MRRISYRMYVLFAALLALFTGVKCGASNVYASRTLDPLLNHLSVDNDTGVIYIGAMNRIYQLDSNLSLIQEVKTGPKLDNPRCGLPPVNKVCGFPLKSTNNYNKILLINKRRKILISCGSIFRGACELRRLHNISSSKEVYSETKFGLAGSGHDTTSVAFIAPAPIYPRDVLFVAAPNTDTVKNTQSISMRRLTETFADYYQDRRKSEILFSERSFLQNVNLTYITGFNQKNYSYFLVVHEKFSESRQKVFVSKIIELCGEKMQSFVDAPVRCQTDGKEYNVLKAADVITIENKQLIVGLFTNSSASPNSTDSAVCVYDMEQIQEVMFKNVKLCYAGNKSVVGSEYFQNQDKGCPISKGGITNDEMKCNKLDLATFSKVVGVISVKAEPVITYPDTVLTAVALSKTAEDAVMFIGTASGQLKKLVLETRNNKAREYAEVWIDRGSRINQDLRFDHKQEYMYVMSEHKISKVKIQDCSSRKNCSACLNGDPYCGWCFLENSCTLRSQCSGAANQTAEWDRWRSGMATQCITIFVITPNSTSVTAVSTVLTLELSSILPQKIKYSCEFKELNWTTPAFMMNKSVQCSVPNFTDPQFSGAVDSGGKEVTLAIISQGTQKMIIARKYSFYNCTSSNSCSQCTHTKWGCKWIIKTHICADKNASISHSSLVWNVNDHRVSVPKGPKDCPRISDESNRNKIWVHEAVANTSFNIFGHNLPAPRHQGYRCVFSKGTKRFISNATRNNHSSITCALPAETFESSEMFFNVSVSVIWGDNFKIEDEGNLQVQFYRCEMMAKDCGLCLNSVWKNRRLECAWCGDRCMYLPRCNTPEQVCRKIDITRVNPLVSPLFGGTRVTITGKNLGAKFKDVKNITIGHQQCIPLKEFYKPSLRIVCETTATINVVSAFLKVKINNTLVTYEDFMFHFKDPRVEKIFPRFGPESGGSKITIQGTDLNAGLKITAKIGEFPCRIEDTNNTHQYVCITTAGSSRGQKLAFNMSFDKHNCKLERAFAYRPDPVIKNIWPLQSFSSGGRILTVDGTNLDSVQQPQMYGVYTENGTETVRENCSIISFSKLKCPTPPFVLMMPSRRRTRRYLHSLLLAFHMDDVQSVKNLTTYLDYKPDPTVKNFSEINHIKKLKGDVLIIEGSNLNVAATESDVIVRIGKDHYCNVTTLSTNQLVCTPPIQQPPGVNADGHSDENRLPQVIVIFGNIRFQIGFLKYDNGKLSLPREIIAGIAAAGAFVLILILLVMIIYWRKSTQAERRYRKMQIQLDNLESNVRNECKQAFAELQTDMTDLTNDLIPSGFPVWDYSAYTFNVLFPGMTDHAILHHLSERVGLQHGGGSVFLESGLQQFQQVLNNKYFLLTFIRTLENQKGFSIRDKVNVASLLMIIYQGNMEYATEILKALLNELVEKSVMSRHPKLMLRRTESVVEKLLTNWLSLCLYKHLKEFAGASLFKLYKAIKLQVEKGPVDFVTGDARYSLSEDKLLREKIEPWTLTLTVEHHGEEIQCRVLDCDTITQVKEKFIEALYRNTPFSHRPTVHDLDLEWQQDTENSLSLQDEDTTTIFRDGWKKINTLAHYKVEDLSILTLIRRQQPFKIVNGKIDSGHLDNSVSSDSSSAPIMRVDSDSGTKSWHLVKPNDDVQVKDDGMKMISEIFLTRLLSTKGTLQKFVDDLFRTILTVDMAQLPPVVKYLFDYLDEAARRYNITDPEVVHTWKSNSLPLRFWVNIIKNPDFVFDINKPLIVDSCLSVIAQTFMDSCSTTEHRLGKDSPSNKLLFAKDIPNYKTLVEKYYSDICEMPVISDQDMNSYLAEVSRLPTGIFHVNSALSELYTYVSRYNKEILCALDQEVVTHKQQLSSKLEQVICMIEGPPNRMTYL